MALREIPYQAGVLKDERELTAGPFATDSDGIIWRNGRPQSAPGWTTKASGILGDARKLHEWASIAGEPRLAIGTSTKLYVYSRDRVWDITPFRASGALPTDPVTTVSGSSTVTITLAAHGLSVGDTIYLRGLGTVGGIKIGGRIGTLGSSPFRATTGSTTVVVTHTAHDMNNGDRAHFAGSSNVGGILAAEINRAEGHGISVVDVDTYTFETEAAASSGGTGGGAAVTYQYSQPYLVTSVPSLGTFTVQDNSTASSSTTGGGAVGAYQAEITSGLRTTMTTGGGIFGSGLFGAGLFGSGGGGDPGAVSGPTPLRLWSMDNFGEQLVANIRRGPIYLWTGNLSQRAARIANSPGRCLAVIVTPERYLLACGCDDGSGVFDPLLVRHPDPFDLTDWTPSLTDNAGDFRLSGGTQIMAALPGRASPLILTDTSLYSVNFVGDVDQIYDFDELGNGCGLSSPNAATTNAGELYWISTGFRPYRYAGGRPTEMPCPLSQWFRDESLTIAQRDKLHARFDITYRAVEWHYPADGANECNRYMRVDLPEAERNALAGWSVGRIGRLCWSHGQIFGNKRPFAVSADGKLYEHGGGYSADGAAINRYVEYAPFDAEEGNGVISISRTVLDLDQEQTMTWTWRAKLWPNAEPWVVSTDFTRDLLHSDRRISGRQIGGRLEGATSRYWRLGQVRADVSPSSSK